MNNQSFDFRKFVRRYNLNGLLDDVRWHFEDNRLRVFEMLPSRRMLVDISSPCDAYHGPEEIVVERSRELLKQMAALDENIVATVEKIAPFPEDVLSFTDDRNELVKVLGDANYLPPSPKIVGYPVMEYNRTKLTRQFIDGEIANRRYTKGNQQPLWFEEGQFRFNGYHLAKILGCNRDCITFNLKTSQVGLAVLTFSCLDGMVAKYYMIRVSPDC